MSVWRFWRISRDINVDFNSTDTDLKTTLEGTTKGVTKIFFYSFWDLSLHKNCNLFLELLPNTTTQANWKLTNPSGATYSGPPGTYNQFTLPRDLVLTKQ